MRSETSVRRRSEYFDVAGISNARETKGIFRLTFVYLVGLLL